MNQNNPKNLFDEFNKEEESFSVDYADTYEKEMRLVDNNLNETILEQKIKKLKNSTKNSDESFSLFIQMEDLTALNDMNDKLNITIQDKQKEDYLYVRKFPKYSENDFQNIKNNVYIGLDKIRNSLFNINTNYTQFDQNKKVGPLTPLSFVIESTYQFKPEYCNEMQKKYDRLKKNILYFRTIYGDGNCYYRATIFRYIELLILNKKIDTIKSLIIDIFYSFQTKEIQSRLYIGNEMLNSKLIIQIMIIILELVENNRIAEAYRAFYNSILFSKIFDYSLILYLRFIIYIYIKNNEKKLYLESFPVLIGNLLPSIYEKNGVFDFNSFYENYLLKMFQFAEKIVIYLTPFVLGIDLNVVLFDDNEKEIVKKFGFAGKSDLSINDTIFILNRIGHYENIYSIEDNQKYNYIYSPYRTDIRPRFINVDYSLCANLNNNFNNNNYNNQNNNNYNQNNSFNNKGYQNNNFNNNLNNNFSNNTRVIYNQYNAQNNQNNNMDIQNNNNLQSKTVINKNTKNDLRNMYFPNLNGNYNNNYYYQNQNNYNGNNVNNNYYGNNNNNNNNNFYRTYTKDNIQYNQNNNYQNNNYSQHHNYLRLNSFNQQQMGNMNYQQQYENNNNNQNYNNNLRKEEGYENRSNIFYYSDKNNVKNDSIYFKVNNIY